MKKQLIRNKVFETNSSSCHSITISNNNVYNNIPLPDQNGIIHLQSGEFGWEQDTYHYFGSKAAYLIVYIRDWAKEELNEFKDIFEKVLKETTGCLEIEYEDKFWETEVRTSEYNGKINKYTSNLGEGYIDHQSVESQDLHYLFKNTEKMKALLFNSSSYIETDNDNH